LLVVRNEWGSMHLLLSLVEHRFLPPTNENTVVLPCCSGWSEYLHCVFQLVGSRQFCVDTQKGKQRVPQHTGREGVSKQRLGCHISESVVGSHNVSVQW
jgi:hypothetical protein